MPSRRALLLAFAAFALAGALFVGACGDEPRALPTTLVLFTPDTLRWDHISAYAPEAIEIPQPRTPALDGLAAQGLRFVDVRAPAPLTLPSHVTMLAGLPPTATGVRLNTYGRLPPRKERGFSLLPEVLRDAGWTTGAFVSAAVLGARYGLDQAFDHYDDGGLEDQGRASVAERPGAETVAAALAWLKKRRPEEHVFLWVHAFEPHAPYAETGMYAGGVEAVDRVAGALLAGLEAQRPDAAVLVASDHGEALGELNERTHGFLLADGVLRVPLLLRAPGVAPGVRADPAALADIAPTLAGLAGVAWSLRLAPGCGLDLLAGAAPPDRIRIAESLYGHQLHRWAQLRAATGPEGTLISAGADRNHWLPFSGWQRILPSTGVVRDTAEVRRLARALVDYNHTEDAGLIVQGQQAGGYGGGGPVSSFLPAEENARLPDPHNAILLHQELDALKARILGERLPSGQPVPVEARLAILGRTVEDLDLMVVRGRLAASPEAWFWVGETYNRLGIAKGGDARSFREAEAAYLKAFELGRKDTETLVRACGANALDHEEEALARLEALAAQVPALGCQYWVLRAGLIRTLEALGLRPEGAGARACSEAEAACSSARDRALLERTCR